MMMNFTFNLFAIAIALVQLCPTDGFAFVERNLWPGLNRPLNGGMEPTIYANVMPANVEYNPIHRNQHYWKSDRTFLLRPISLQVVSNGVGEQQQQRSNGWHNPMMERMFLSPFRSARFGRYFNEMNNIDGGFGKRQRRHRIRGLKGEINVKWAMMPIWEKNEIETENKPSSDELLPFHRSNREWHLLSRSNHFPTLTTKIEQMPQPERQSLTEVATTLNSELVKLHRIRRQIGAKSQQIFNRFLSKASGLFDNLGRQMSQQLQSSVAEAGRNVNGLFSSMQNKFRRMVNLNISQLRPDRLLSQLSNLARTQ
ncbi:hypothetical protein RDWZM_007733 [Blomia tropicalis]|uniref:Uncharacterized protein n=1 Tax=Blomia tropicalis TaxID=40697 RepID=A0A9Q0RJD6_BLOTA|nr:hypothetical protein RDWZM_007733 [Blomia tropicalis]